jgi:hypothetical protein
VRVPGSRAPPRPKFQHNKHTKVATLSALCTGRLYPSGNISCYHFSYRLSRLQCHSQLKIPMTPLGIESATCRLVPQCPNLLRQHVPRINPRPVTNSWGCYMEDAPPQQPSRFNTNLTSTVFPQTKLWWQSHGDPPSIPPSQRSSGMTDPWRCCRPIFSEGSATNCVNDVTAQIKLKWRDLRVLQRRRTGFGFSAIWRTHWHGVTSRKTLIHSAVGVEIRWLLLMTESYKNCNPLRCKTLNETMSKQKFKKSYLFFCKLGRLS